MARDITFDIIARDKASRVFDKVGSASGGLEKKFGGIGKVAAVGFGAAAAGAAALTTGLGASITKAMDYDKTMRLVGATLGTTGQQQKALSALALKMGADTVFSAADAGNAMLELAKGGLTTAQIRGGALAATMTLAAAGGLEMGAAATYVGNALNTFGLKAKDAASVAAALAGGANASSASVESLGLGLSQVGPGAKMAGLSIQETVAALSALDAAGVKGSDAGTSLKTMLTRLAAPAGEGAKMMTKLGLSVYDARGAIVPFPQMLDRVAAATKGMTEEQRNLAMSTIFGSDAIRAGLVLSGQGSRGLKKFTDATSNQTAAQKMANTQMEGASGAWEAFKGSVETLAIQVGVKLLPTFTRIVKGLTEVTNNILTTAGPTVQRFSGWFKNDLWPALQKGYQTIMPGVKRILDVVTSAVGDSGISWKKVGDVLTKYVIPFIAKMISTYLPALEGNIRFSIFAIKAIYRAFEAWRDVVARVISFIVGKFADMMDVWAAVLRTLGKVPGFGWAKTAADKMQGAADKAHGISRAIAAIPKSKTVTVNIQSRVQTGRVKVGDQMVNVGMRAKGGPIHVGRPYLVGENGPEMVIPRNDGMVIPSQLSSMITNMAAGAGGTPGGGDQNVTVQFVLDGKVLQQSLLKVKRQGGVSLGLA